MAGKESTASASHLQKADVILQEFGELVLLRPNSDRGRVWLAERLSRQMRYCGAVVIEARHVHETIRLMLDENLLVEAPGPSGEKFAYA